MHLHDTPEDAAYRLRVRAWLAANAPPFLLPESKRLSSVGANLEEGRVWLQHKADAGYAGINLPKEFGGQGEGVARHCIFLEEEAEFPVPKCGSITGQIEILLATLTQYGQPWMRDLVKRLVRGDDLWCQLFSEPGAGSDVANISTRATRDGDHWVLNGQKAWNSGAHFADWGFIVTRTNPDVPKHKGLTCFIVDMKSPGIEIRPVRQATGEMEFNDVFFNDVIVSAENVVGEPDGGWAALLCTVTAERTTIAELPSLVDDYFTDLLALTDRLTAEGHRLIDTEQVRSKLAHWHVTGEGARLFLKRVLTNYARGKFPGPETALCKLVLGRRQYEMAAYAMDLIGEDAMSLDDPNAFNLPRLHSQLFWSFGTRIGGGSDDILRNILGDYVLQLPQDVRLDKATSYKDGRA